MDAFAALLNHRPELALFLSIVLGSVIGAFHWKGVGFGSVVGTLIAGILIGVFAKPQLPELLRWSFFYLFLFSIGYAVGPQFFGSLKKESLPQIALALVVALTGLATVIAAAVAFGFDEGTAVGLLSGGMTQSAALGTGLNAIAALPIPEDLKATLSANAPLADAITYGFGDLGLIVFLTVIGPRLMGADLRREAQELEQKLAATRGASGQTLPGVRYGFRAYRIDDATLSGTSVAELEERYAQGRLAVQRLQRAGELLPVEPALRLKQGDLVVVSAQRHALADFERSAGSEVDEPELLAIPMKEVSVVVTSREVHGKSIAELGADRTITRGAYLESLRRGEVFLPREPWTVIERGDVMRVVGAPEDVERVGAHAGFIDRDIAKTDLAFLAGGVCLGIVAGLLTFKVRGMPLGLGTAGSILVVGLLAGWARSRYPVFGAIPEPAQRLLADIGLIVFIAIVGLNAGPHAVDALREEGGRHFASIFLAGMIVTLVPLAAGSLFARLVLRMSPLMILGGLAGAQTCTPGLNALREASGSNVGALAYTVPYAIGNILLTIWGPVVVAVMHAIRA